MAIFITALIVVAYVAWRFSRGGAALPKAATTKNPCKWSKTGESSGAFVEYKCSTCGVAAYGRVDAAPKDCKKGLTGGL